MRNPSLSATFPRIARLAAGFALLASSVAFAQDEAEARARIEAEAQARYAALEAEFESALVASGGSSGLQKRATAAFARGLRELGTTLTGETAERALADSVGLFNLAGEAEECKRTIADAIPRMSSWDSRFLLLQAVAEVPGQTELARTMVEKLTPDARSNPKRMADLGEIAKRFGGDFGPPRAPAPPPAAAPGAAAPQAPKAAPPKPSAPRRAADDRPGVEPIPFDERSTKGKRISLSGLKGKVVLIDFWATWCGPCIAELPNVKRAYDAFHKEGFEVIGVSLDEDAKLVDRFAKENDMPWPQICDEKGWEAKLAQAYGVRSIPATFLVDRRGLIVASDLRGEELLRAVATLVAE